MSAVDLAKPSDFAEVEEEREAGGGRGPGGPRYVARAELVLSGPDHRPLGQGGLDPDPLEHLAAVFAQVRTEAGEEAELVVDLVPVRGSKVARRRRVLMRRATRRGPSAYGEQLGSGGRGGVMDVLRGGLGGAGGPGVGQGPVRVPRQSDLSEGVGKFTPGAEVFAAQVLVRCVARHPRQAQARLHQVMAAMEAFSGENRLVPVGPKRGLWRGYSNVWWLRRGFDRRLQRGDFAPRRRQWVTWQEIAGLLKPPTARCGAPNVARCGGVVPPAPAALPTWTGQREVLPLGLVTGPDGNERLAGARTADVLFGAFYGKSGFGKTEMGLVQCLARAYAGDGCWFLDPHGAAWQRARPYLAHPAVAGRVWEVNLARPAMDDRMACWNPLSMEGRAVEEVQDVVGSVVGAVASAHAWGENATRARTILSSAARTLAHLSHHLVSTGHPQLQPTVFQIRTLLEDEEWREAVLAVLDPQEATFWRRSFPDMEASARNPVTNALYRMDNSLSLKAFLGSPRSAYDVRRAMDERQIVFVCPSGTGESDDLVTALLLFDLFRAGMSRIDTAVEGLAPFWTWADELTAVDGASHGHIAKILEQLRKFEVRFMGMTQMAMRLSAETRAALMQNQSLLSATAADFDEAGFVTRRLPGIDPETVLGLDKYEYIQSVMLRGRRTTPFRVRGVPVDEVFADYRNEAGLPALDAAIDTNLGRRTVGEILQVQRGLDDAILDHLVTGRTSKPRPAGDEGGDVVRTLRPY
ncbi:ATP/GTP-binding protein [Streptomyces pinistramenti]|uniref:ATP/GTP-binding protein n=1 Tax=Streptomyces pinistramenti TaxID=2884812 RepID=UPI001D076178|nr:ATP/GTP-binding protein [Streptomyces pinistramenti]MCB5910391.1 ATP/GTP-binding protein [Streptomyces pinistramenti]